MATTLVKQLRWSFWLTVLCALGLSLKWLIPWFKWLRAKPGSSSSFSESVFVSSSSSSSSNSGDSTVFTQTVVEGVVVGEGPAFPPASEAVVFAYLAPVFAGLFLLTCLVRCAVSRRAYRVRRDARERRGPLSYVPYTEATVDAEVERLRESFRRGISRSIKWRKQQLMSLHDLLVEHEEDICRAVVADTHKGRRELAMFELCQTRADILYLVDHLDELCAPQRVMSSMSVLPSASYIYREPLGVVCVIATWNYPVALSLMPLVGALAGGNCTIMKLSNMAEHYSPLMASLLPKYLDMRCFAVEWTGHRQLIQAVLAQDIDMLFFTGSAAVGRRLYETVAPRMVPVLLELGGKNMAIVDCRGGAKTVNLELAAKRIAWGKFINAGQTCIAPDFVICVDGGEPAHTQATIDALCRQARAQFGTTVEEQLATDSYCRLVNDAAVQRCQRLLARHKDAIVMGGQVDGAERFVAPTVIDATGISPDEELMTEELFAPILPVCSVATVEEAIELANTRQTPLAMYTFSYSRAFQNACLRGIRSGGACVNDTLVHFSNSHLPFGGFRSSGIGRYHGKYSFEAFTHARSTVVSSLNSCCDLPIRYMPYRAGTDLVIGTLNWWNSI